MMPLQRYYIFIFFFIPQLGYTQKLSGKEGMYKIYDNKKLKSIEYYHNNQPNGTWTIFNNNLDSVNIFYSNGIVQGEKYWNNKGFVVLDVSYKYQNKDTLSLYTEWSDSFPFIMKRKKHVLNGKAVGYFINKYDNGNKKIEGFYSMDTNSVSLERKQYFIFLDDFFINGVKITNGNLGACVTTSTLQDEYYENGNIKMRIIPVQKDELKGQVIYYTEEGKVREINSIEYGILTQKNIVDIINAQTESTLIGDIIKERFLQIEKCWYLEGESYFFNDSGKLVRMISYHKGKESISSN